ncbi:FAD-dependent oxidoreductase [Cytobacillus oceanisediminis]|uniref:FAD-dependent oxidoreductase n=1 Tax=Cytobacillus oceanisediminis TaxID=665099 RepID=UPI001C212459|nr:NAD(P)/FAD-dependent oxidoreductase [Cytobacillus oceanisediminis]MBU8773231.1 FAD-dependent monooxygenase [Cytobacillus oceanisediminis]
MGQVIIVGGGIAGLAMSLFLKKANIESVIYEQAPAFGKVGGHFVIHPSGVQMLEMLGLGEEIKKNSHHLVDFAVLDKFNNPLFDEVEAELELEEMPYFINIARYHLIDVLYKEAVKQGIDIHFGKRLKGFIQEAEGVNVTFEDGTKDFGSILIGADGVRSKTRELLFPFPANPLKYLGKTGVYGMIETEKLGELKEYFTTDTSLMYFHDNFNFFVSKHHPTDEEISWSLISTEPRKIAKKDFEGKPIEELKADLAARFNGWEMPIQQLIEATDHIIAKQLFRIDLMEHYSHGRVVLIGDALHTADPNAGMGTTLAFEDAMYLAKMLRDYDYEDAFYYFEHDRKPRAEKVFHSANLLDNLEFDNVEDYAFFNDGVEATWDKI